MIIQCAKCQTKFRLDDSRVTEKGVKVRCTKCKHVFSVKKEVSEPDFAAPAAPFDVETPVQTQTPPPGEPDTFNPFESSSFDAPAAPFETGTPENSAVADVVPPEKDEAFGDFDFGYDAPETAEPPADDFDNLPEPPDSVTSAAEEGAPFFQKVPFDAVNIDFGDEPLPVVEQPETPQEEEPFREIFSRRPAEELDTGREGGLTQVLPDDQPAPAGALLQLPPLSITSRRKQSSLFSAVIAISAVLLVSALGYLGYTTFIAPKNIAVAPEAGKLAVQGVKAAFIGNREAGELLVISGTTRNDFPKPRAALQVKVTVFDASGQEVGTKSAYCGNMLTDEQLKSLPLDKIEAAMANQFGDSLVNMEVAPGKTIPFVVVLAAVPKGAKDFAVQPTGSTVAAGTP